MNVQFTSDESLSFYIDSLSWDFGDPFASPEENQSTDLNPVHNYTEAGTYTVTQTVYTMDCFGEAVSSVVIGPMDTMTVDTMTVDTMIVDSMGTSIQTLSENPYKAIKIHPNPSNGNTLYLSNLESLNGKSVELAIYLSLIHI